MDIDIADGFRHKKITPDNRFLRLNLSQQENRNLIKYAHASFESYFNGIIIKN